MTDEKALVAHAHGISSFPCSARRRIPVGNGNPIRKPKGKTAVNVRIILKGRPR